MSPKQKKLMKLMKERNGITNAGLQAIYTTKQYGLEVIRFLIQMRYAKIDGSNFGRYVLTQEGLDYLEAEGKKEEENENN